MEPFSHLKRRIEIRFNVSGARRRPLRKRVVKGGEGKGLFCPFKHFLFFWLFGGGVKLKFI